MVRLRDRRYVSAMSANPQPIGELLRGWRIRRRMSQLDLAGETEMSARHLSFLETGRSLPSRNMVLRLARQLDVPLRERNILLTAAGFAPIFSERSLGDPALASAHRAVDLILKGHEPFPALAVDRHWMLVAANDATQRLFSGIDPALLAPPVNVLRISLHQDGLARLIENLAEWRAYVFERLQRQIEATADAKLIALLDELRSYPLAGRPGPVRQPHDVPDIAVPLRLTTPNGTLNFISTTTIFGTPVDITLSELAVEAFFPADDATATALRQLATSEGAVQS